MKSTSAFKVLASITLLVSGIESSPHSLNSRVVTTISGWNDAGCYTEATDMRALTGNSYFDDSMTLEKCATVCNGYAWFGVEYGRECYCGNVINVGSVVAQNSDCSFSCPGNAAENCGAGNRLTMYSRSSVGGGSTPSTTFSSLGCWTEGLNGRTLVEKTTASDLMTVEQCASSCEGFTYFGLEYYRECYCGNSLLDGSTAAPSSDCNHQCMGDRSELCGGDSRLNLYQFGSVASTTTATPSTHVATTLPSSDPQPTSSSYTNAGCYTEATGQRALSLGSYFDDFMTIPKCAAVCAGYLWFGIEYGRECYCGNIINAGSVPTDDSQCSFVCPGDRTTYCGAGDRLNMYHYGIATTSTAVSFTTTSIQSSSSSSTTSSAVVLSSVTSTSSTVASIETTSSTTSSSSLSQSSSESSSSTLASSAAASTSAESSTVQSSSSSTISTSTETLSSSSSSLVPSSTVISTTSSSAQSIPSTSSSQASSSTAVPTSTSTFSSVSSTISSFVTSTSTSSSSSSSLSSSTSTSAAPVCTLTSPITNSGFESLPDTAWSNSNTGIGTGNYVSTTVGIAAHSGTGKGRVQLSFNTAIVNVYQTITVCPGFAYTLSGWARRVSNTGGLTCQVTYKLGGSTIGASTFSSAAGQALVWTETRAVVTPTVATVQFMMTVTCPQSLGLSTTYGMFLDDITLTLA